MKEHRYSLTVVWTGAGAGGTTGYASYSRDHEIRGAHKQPILASSDPSFRGDASRYNPEELLVASLSQCHMLWYLHLCARNGIVVTRYEDRPEGTMIEGADRGGTFAEVVLRPVVTVAASAMSDQASGLHSEARRLCFIANSVNFPVRHEPSIGAEETS